MRNSLKLAISILGLAPMAALAMPILNVDSSGQLLGASNVDVNGSSYNVEFVEGDCYDVYDGCQAANFTFTTAADARAASWALLLQVFTDFATNGLGNFDSLPHLTRGCTSTTRCDALTPWRLAFGVRYDIAGNLDSDSPWDLLQTGESGFTLDREDTVWVVWTATTPTSVPEPSTISLLALGLIGMAYRRKR